MTNASIQRVLDLAGRLERLLLSIGDTRYSRDLRPLINTAAAISYGAIRTLSIDLPREPCRAAKRIADRVNSFFEGSERSAEWAIRQGWHDLTPEAPSVSYGISDIFIESQSIIVEVGDCRIDKPMVAARLRYSLLVVPASPMSSFSEDFPADATLFFPGPDVDALKLFIEETEQ